VRGPGGVSSTGDRATEAIGWCVSDLEEAARRVAAGDRAAFEAIVRSTEKPLLRAAARVLGNREEALDVLQDAYLRAFDALLDGSFDGRARVSSWLYRVVMNAALDALRARRRRPTLPMPDSERETRGTEGNGAEARVALAELAKMLDLLPEEQRAALVLRELEGLSNAEVAEVLETTEGAIEQRLIRARATLRRRFDER
jgi:RNA polymerase sigma-70 factor, ECF subfamily